MQRPRSAASIRVAPSLLLAVTIAAGQQSPEARLKQLSLGQLGDIEVTTASREPVKIARTPAAIHVLTREDIRRSGATSIPEVLQLVPGVEVARIDAVKWSVGIRGFSGRLSRAMLVVIDGRNVYSPLYAGVYWEVQDTLHPKLYVDVAAFRNRYDNLLSTEIGKPFAEASPEPVHLVIPLSFGNGLYGSTTGFETTPNWRPAPWWQLEGSYSYLTLDLNKQATSTDPGSIQSSEGSSPHHQIVAKSWFKLPKHLEFSQTYRYVSALPAQQVGSYRTADAWLSWRPGERMELSVTGRDLLQPHHPEFGGDPGGLVGIKRAVYATVTWQQAKGNQIE
jgi:outer membrane receptor for ferrienterochelin and colicin